jgi:hypothetical protein
MVASVESLLGSGHEFDAAEMDVAGKAWADASAALWSLLGTKPRHDTDCALVRIGLNDFAGVLTENERLTRRVAELEAKLAEREARRDSPLALRETIAPKDEQDILPLYIAGGSSERLMVGRPWIDRAREAGARITFDWSRASGYDEQLGEKERLTDVMNDIGAVMRAGVFWLLAPAEVSEGAATELGIAIATAIKTRTADKPRTRIVISGPHANRNFFALIADEIHATHEEAWEAIKPRVIGAGERATA